MRLKCKELVKKIAVYKNKLAVSACTCDTTPSTCGILTPTVHLSTPSPPSPTLLSFPQVQLPERIVVFELSYDSDMHYNVKVREPLALHH